MTLLQTWVVETGAAPVLRNSHGLALCRRKKFFGPRRFFVGQRRGGRAGIVEDFGVAAAFVALVHEHLKVQRDVEAGVAQRDADGRQPLAQGQHVEFASAQPGWPGDGDIMIDPPRESGLQQGTVRQRPSPAAQQVNFHHVDAAAQVVEPFAFPVRA